MAANMESSINRGCDFIFDFSCVRCQDENENTEADFYCENCSEFYCKKCVESHNAFYKKHEILGKKNISQWPKTNVGGQEKCQEHRKEKLTGFCEDHSQLICHACHVHTHQKCMKVLLIDDKVEELDKNGDFKQLSATVDSQHQKLIQKKDDLEQNMKSLEKSYKNIKEEINALRKKINNCLNLMEKITKEELDSLLATMRTSIQSDIENCAASIKQITCVKENWLKREEKSKTLNLIMFRKFLDQSHKVDAVLQEMATKNERTLTFFPYTSIQQFLVTGSGLGKILRPVKTPHERKTLNTVTTQKKSKVLHPSRPHLPVLPPFLHARPLPTLLTPHPPALPRPRPSNL